MRRSPRQPSCGTPGSGQAGHRPGGWARPRTRRCSRTGCAATTGNTTTGWSGSGRSPAPARTVTWPNLASFAAFSDARIALHQGRIDAAVIGGRRPAPRAGALVRDAALVLRAALCLGDRRRSGHRGRAARRRRPAGGRGAGRGGELLGRRLPGPRRGPARTATTGHWPGRWPGGRGSTPVSSGPARCCSWTAGPTKGAPNWPPSAASRPPDPSNPHPITSAAPGSGRSKSMTSAPAIR